MQDDLIVVGAMGDSEHGSHAGAVFLFRHDGTAWVQETKLTPLDAGPSMSFGSAVDINADRLIVGAFADDVVGTNSGSAYVFRYDGSDWVQEAKLLPDDPGAFNTFGRHVAIDGIVAVCGDAGGNHGIGMYTGAAHVFRFDGAQWNQEQKLDPGDLEVDDDFGAGVVVQGDTILAGAPGRSAVYAFGFDGAAAWQLDQILTPPEPGYRFGIDIALLGSTAVTGSFDGVAYTWRHDGTAWSVQLALRTTDFINAGALVALSTDLVVTGVAGAPPSATGAAYVFPVTGSDGDGDGLVGITDFLILLANWS